MSDKESVIECEYCVGERELIEDDLICNICGYKRGPLTINEALNVYNKAVVKFKEEKYNSSFEFIGITQSVLWHIRNNEEVDNLNEKLRKLFINLIKKYEPLDLSKKYPNMCGKSFEILFRHYDNPDLVFEVVQILFKSTIKGKHITIFKLLCNTNMIKDGSKLIEWIIKVLDDSNESDRYKLYSLHSEVINLVKVSRIYLTREEVEKIGDLLFESEVYSLAVVCYNEINNKDRIKECIDKCPSLIKKRTKCKESRWKPIKINENDKIKFVVYDGVYSPLYYEYLVSRHDAKDCVEEVAYRDATPLQKWCFQFYPMAKEIYGRLSKPDYPLNFEQAEHVLSLLVRKFFLDYVELDKWGTLEEIKQQFVKDDVPLLVRNIAPFNDLIGLPLLDRRVQDNQVQYRITKLTCISPHLEGCESEFLKKDNQDIISINGLRNNQDLLTYAIFQLNKQITTKMISYDEIYSNLDNIAKLSLPMKPSLNAYYCILNRIVLPKNNYFYEYWFDYKEKQFYFRKAKLNMKFDHEDDTPECYYDEMFKDIKNCDW